MPKSKDELEEAADNWASIAESRGYHCEVCGCRIPYEERETYFETYMCDWCRHQMEKDD